jgi:hypothetical protein
VVKKIGFIALLLLLPTALIAQNAESATGGEASITAGVEMSAFNPDWGCSTSSPFGCQTELFGPTALFDFDLHQKYGIEGEARWLHWHGVGGEVESNYLVGPRYRLFRYRRFTGLVQTGSRRRMDHHGELPGGGQPQGQLFRVRSGWNIYLSIESEHVCSR